MCPCPLFCQNPVPGPQSLRSELAFILGSKFSFQARRVEITSSMACDWNKSPITSHLSPRAEDGQQQLLVSWTHPTWRRRVGVSFILISPKEFHQSPRLFSMQKRSPYEEISISIKTILIFPYGTDIVFHCWQFLCRIDSLGLLI